jgi:hypothetical protein
MNTPLPLNRTRHSDLRVGIVSTEEERLKAYAVRIAVYLEGQDCPWDEEAGNDQVAARALGSGRTSRISGCDSSLDLPSWNDSLSRQFRGRGYADPLVRFAMEYLRARVSHAGAARAVRPRDLLGTVQIQPYRGPPRLRLPRVDYTEMAAALPHRRRDSRLGCDAPQPARGRLGSAGSAGKAGACSAPRTGRRAWRPSAHGSSVVAATTEQCGPVSCATSRWPAAVTRVNGGTSPRLTPTKRSTVTAKRPAAASGGTSHGRNQLRRLRRRIQLG